jgi:porphobilinogen synthase
MSLDNTSKNIDMSVADYLSEVRPRRLRRTATLRRLVREHQLTTDDLVHPMFVTDGHNIERPIEPMPGHSQRSVDRLDAEIDALVARNLSAVLLFGIPDTKDAQGSGAWAANGPVPRAIAAFKQRAPDIAVIADVCLCEYTDHGHCGIIHDESGDVANDATLPLLAQTAVAYADAGADIVAPSAMMDGQVAVIREGLDAAGHGHVPIMAYSAKYASAFYGPFRVAADSTPQFGDRRAYQMDPPNAREALREVELDVAEGADIVMVKPAGVYLDIIRQVRDRVDLPIAAYQVSGEYAMLKAAAERGWLDDRRSALESLMAIKRAGADLIITYYAKEAAVWLSEKEGNV